MCNIVLCGSMRVKDKIISISHELENMGYNVLLPKECIEGLSKDVASRAHFDRVADIHNQVVLIVNEEKENIKNYIGPNTFAEIALSYYFNKNIYLLNDIYEPYRDELLGWNIKVLHGDLNKLKVAIQSET